MLQFEAFKFIKSRGRGGAHEYVTFKWRQQLLNRTAHWSSVWGVEVMSSSKSMSLFLGPLKIQIHQTHRSREREFATFVERRKVEGGILWKEIFLWDTWLQIWLNIIFYIQLSLKVIWYSLYVSVFWSTKQIKQTPQQINFRQFHLLSCTENYLISFVCQDFYLCLQY